MDVVLYFFGILLVLIPHNVVHGDNCTFSKPCACKSYNFDVDLSPLRKLRKHPLTVKDNDVTFYLNPCGKSVLVKSCKLSHAAGCMKIGGRAYGIAGTSDYTATGDPELNNVRFRYSFGTGSQKRSTVMRVECSSDVHTLKYDGEEPAKTYNFALYTKYACKDYHPTSGNTATLGPVYSLLLLVIILVLVYFLGGILYLKFYKKKEGLDVIPHRQFWQKIPMMFKGCCASGSDKGKGDGTYDKI